MEKVWEIAPRRFDDLIEQLLYNRGIKTEGEREEFFHPQLENFEKDFDLPGAKKAIKRIHQAAKRKELVVIFGDYDADGLCGAAVLYNGLMRAGVKALPYIPHREKEGYGLSKAGLDFAREQGASLVITVDNGIVAVEPAKYAHSLGLDLIITDHHTPAQEKPEALSIIHSTKMSGTAVAWCLVHQLVGEQASEELLDLVAVATIADLLPLLGVNRALAAEGLRRLNKTKRPGFLALFAAARLLPGQIGAYEVGHILGPRLNALGRLEHAMDSLRLLCTKNREKAARLADVLCSANDQKKKLTSDAAAQAMQLLDTEYKDGMDKVKVLILHSKQWIPGIIGLLAGRLAEEHGLPAVVISEGEVFSKGSARTAGGVNIVKAIRGCSGLLVDVGGHPAAAGFTLESSKIAPFKKQLEFMMQQVEVDRRRKLPVEAIVQLSEINLKLVEKLQKFEPTGAGNPPPVLASYKMRLGDLRTVGGGSHLKFKVEGFEAIGFNMGEMINLMKEEMLANIAYRLEINRFNGRETLQLNVLDIQLV